MVSRPPLAGVRVLDFSQILAAAICKMYRGLGVSPRSDGAL